MSSRSCSYSSGAASSSRRATRSSRRVRRGACRRRPGSARARRGQLVELAEHRRERAVERRRVGLRVACARPRGPSWRCTRAASVRSTARRGVGVEREQERALERGIVEQLVDEAGPALLERDLRRDVVEHLDARRQAGLDRVLGEEPLRERVQRGDRGRVELVERQRRPAPRRPGRRRARPARARAGCGRAARRPPSR